MQTQTALKNMDYREIKTDGTYRGRFSCTAIALAHLAKRGNPDKEFAQACTSYVMQDEWEAEQDGLFGLRFKALERVYKSVGFRYTYAIVDGTRFPRTCILWLKSKATGEAHVVARVNGTLHDSFDCRDEQHGYTIIGFFKEARA